jgi:hypothetical protein
MRRNPLYVFDNLGSVGIYNVPLESSVQINDADGQGSTLIVQIISKEHLTPSSTIGDFLANTDNYERPSAIGMVTDEEKGRPNGVAPLDERGFVPGIHIPTMDINDVYVVQTIQDMLDLTNNVNIGDVVVVVLENKSYIYNGGKTGTIQDWTQLVTQGGTVQSVNGKSGHVTLDADDIPAGAVNKYMNPITFKDYLSQERLETINNVYDGPANPGDALTFDGVKWGAAQIPQKVVSVNGQDGVVILSTDEIAEGNNLYYTDTRVNNNIQTNWIDPVAGIGDYNKIWSADKIATEISYLTTKDYVVNGLALKLDKTGGTITGDVEIRDQ